MAQSADDIIKQVMADILDIDPATIEGDTGMDNVEDWDSANHINLVMGLEEEFSVSFDVAEIESMITFDDILATVEAKL